MVTGVVFYHSGSLTQSELCKFIFDKFIRLSHFGVCLSGRCMSDLFLKVLCSPSLGVDVIAGNNPCREVGLLLLIHFERMKKLKL